MDGGLDNRGLHPLLTLQGSPAAAVVVAASPALSRSFARAHHRNATLLNRRPRQADTASVAVYLSLIEREEKSFSFRTDSLLCPVRATRDTTERPAQCAFEGRILTTSAALAVNYCASSLVRASRTPKASAPGLSALGHLVHHLPRWLGAQVCPPTTNYGGSSRCLIVFHRRAAPLPLLKLS
jgi:hypothetical protein